jgi:hypothetical protein
MTLTPIPLFGPIFDGQQSHPATAAAAAAAAASTTKIKHTRTKVRHLERDSLFRLPAAIPLGAAEQEHQQQQQQQQQQQRARR